MKGTDYTKFYLRSEKCWVDEWRHNPKNQQFYTTLCLSITKNTSLID